MLQEEYDVGQPFKHVVVDQLFQDSLLRDVKEECLKLAFTKKETDIYKGSSNAADDFYLFLSFV